MCNIQCCWHFYDVFESIFIPWFIKIGSCIYTWPTPDLQMYPAVSKNPQHEFKKKKKKLQALWFSHGFPMTRFAIWKLYSYCQSIIHIWPISGSDSKWLFRHVESWPPKRIYVSLVSSAPHNLEILRFSVNLKPHVTPTAYWYSNSGIGSTENFLMQQTEFAISVRFPGSLWDRKCVWLKTLRLGGLLECLHAVPPK